MGKPMENPIERDVLDELYTTQKLSAAKIAAIYKVKSQQIYYLLGKYGIPRRSLTQMNTTYEVNHEFFATIDSSEKAYWLGFLYADGYVTKQHKVGVALARVDYPHLLKFRDAVQSTHPIHSYTASGFSHTEYDKLIFASVQMAADLERLGCFQQKSLILKFPTQEQVPEKYLRDFVRGYIDGDGCITTGGTLHPLRLKVCGTKEFLNGLKAYLNSIIDPDEISSHLEKRHKDKKNTFSLTVSSPFRVLKILNELYKDATVYLDRKYVLYIEKKDALTQSSLSEMVGV